MTNLLGATSLLPARHVAALTRRGCLENSWYQDRVPARTFSSPGRGEKYAHGLFCHHLPRVVEVALDPVCGMSVDRASAPAQAKVNGRTYYFCANGCREEFLAAPEKFLNRMAGPVAEH